MTKTLKKGLVVFLMFVMAVLVGAAAAAFSYAKADEAVNPKYGEFEGYMTQFTTALEGDVISELTAEELFPDEATADIQALWQAYNNAKRLYNEFSNTDKAALSAESKTTYNSLDIIFNDVNGLVVRATSRMVQVYQAKIYLTGHEDVEKLTADLEALKAGEYGTGKYAYVLFSTNNLRAYENAKNTMQQIKECMLEAIEAIKAIRFFDGEGMAEEGYVDAVLAETTAQIVVGNKADEGSKPSLEEVAEILKGVPHLNIDYVCITSELTEEELDEVVDYYAIFKAAEEEYELQFTYIAAVKALIEELYLEDGTYYCVEGESFYIYKEYITDAENEYDGLLEYAAIGTDDVNYNDLQYYLGEGGDFIKDSDTYKDALDYLTNYIDETDEKIQQVVDAFEALPEAKFNDADYIAALDKITAMLFGTDNEELFFGDVPEQEQLIDADILAHDKALYEEALEEFYAELYADIDEDHQIPDYIIGIYAKYVEAVEDYEDMLADLIDLVKKVQDMVDHHFNGENVTSEYNEIEETWNKFTEEQREYFNDQTVDYPEDPDKSYEDRSEDWQAGNKDKQRCEDVLEWILADINKLADDVAGLDSSILDLWAATTGAGDCVYDRRDEVEALIDQYLEYDEAHQAYITNSDKLWEMKAEIDAEQALIDAWVAAVGEMLDYNEDIRICDVWASVEAAVEAFNAVKHQIVVEGSISVEITDGEVVITAETEDDENEADEHKLQGLLQYEEELAEAYAAYTEAVAAMAESKKLIDDAAKLMAMIDTSVSEDDIKIGEALKAWNDAYDAAAAAWENLAKEQESGKTYFGAQAHLMHSVLDEEIFNNEETAWDKGETDWTYKAAYENFIKAADLKDQFGLEQDIEELPDPDDVTLADAGKIQDAEEKRGDLNKKYEEKYPDQYTEDDTWADDKVRNNDKLDDVLEALKKLTEELDKWIAAVEEAVANAEFGGYPFNIYSSEEMEELGLDGNSYYTLLDWYDELTGEGSKKEEVEYLAETKAKLEELKKASDKAIEDLNNDIKDINDKFYTEEGELNGKIPSGDDLDMIKDILDRYNKFHQSQRDQIDEEELKKFEDLIDSQEVPDGFVEMLEELYNEAVINGNVTSYTPYYLEVLRTIYSDFNSAVKEMFKITVKVETEEGEYEDQTLTFDEIVAKIEEAIKDARDEEGNLPSLKGAFESIADLEAAIEEQLGGLQETIKEFEEKFGALAGVNEALEGLKTQYNDLKSALDALTSRVEDLENWKKEVEGKLAGITGSIDEKIDEKIADLKQELIDAITNAFVSSFANDLSSALEEAFQKFAADITAAYEAYTDAAIDDLRDELQGNINELETTLKGLIEAEKTARENGDKELADKLAAAKSELEGKIAAAKSELESMINSAKGALEAADKALSDRIDGVSSAITDAETKLNKAIDDAKADLETKIADAKAELEGKINGVKDDLTKAQGELNGKIDTLEETLKGLIEAEKTARENGDKDLADKLAAEKSALQAEIAAAKSELEGKIADAKAELEAIIAALNVEDINGLIEKLNAASTELVNAKADLESKIAAAKTELDGKIAAAKADLEAAINELEVKMNAADAKLQEQIDALNSKTTTMLVLVIVLAVVLVAAVVCIILLFVKRNKANV